LRTTYIKRAVVTGGAGFIGSHIADELVARGYQVAIIDDLSTGNKENIASLLNQNHVEFTEGSIADLSVLTKLFRGAKYVFHLAAIPSVPRSIENPQASHEANITGTLKVLLAARDAAVKKVVYASSCAVYGGTCTLPIKEDTLPNPQSPYAVTKLAGEYYCQVFHQVYGLPTVCLRYFNVYGPRQDPDSEYSAVIPKFIQRVLNDKPLLILGDGEQTRDFTFITDVVEANILLAESQATGIFNIGSGQRISIAHLAELLIGLAGNNVKLIHKEPRPGDIKHSLADISKAQSFGYKPKYSLERGLAETIGSFQYDT